jgi:general secretion pathway protein K
MSDPSPPVEKGKPRGVILLIVLWAVTMMTVVIAALGTNVRTSANLAGTETRRLKTEMLLEGGIDVAAAALVASGDQVQTLSDAHITQIDLGNGNIAALRIRDAGGLVDINRAQGELLAGVIAHITGSADVGKATAQLITQWRSSAVEPTQGSQPQNGADGLNQVSQPQSGANGVNQVSQPQSGANGVNQGSQTQSSDGETNQNQESQPPAFISTAQLYGITGIDRKVVATLLPFVSLYSKGGHINLAAAPPEVIAGIPEITPLQIETLQNARDQRNWESPDVKDIVSNLEDYASLEASNIFIIDLELVQSAGLILGTRASATVMIDPSADTPFHVLARSW